MTNRSMGVMRTTNELLRVMDFFGRPGLRFLMALSFSFTGVFIVLSSKFYRLRPPGVSAGFPTQGRDNPVFCIAKK
ncbi:hypothetical protein FM107_01395 [Sphingobacterium sp. JB170]|nr:hypothetical protein FM107_01395 [Sphingobacterium sp. JB170]